MANARVGKTLGFHVCLWMCEICIGMLLNNIPCFYVVKMIWLFCLVYCTYCNPKKYLTAITLLNVNELIFITSQHYLLTLHWTLFFCNDVLMWVKILNNIMIIVCKSFCVNFSRNCLGIIHSLCNSEYQ